VLEKTEDFIEATRWSSPRNWAATCRLRRHRRPGAFARHALAIAHAVDAMLQEAQTARDGGQDDGETPRRRRRSGCCSISTATTSTLPEAAPLGAWRSPTATAATGVSTAYDREEKAGELCARPAATARTHGRAHRQPGINTARLARRFTQLLAVPRRDGWSFGEEEATSTAAAWRS
jgi:cobaltochelatase CobT